MPASNPVRIGQVVSTFGLRGGLKVRLAGDFADILVPGARLIVGAADRTVEKVQWHKAQARIWIRGVCTIEDAQALVGSEVLVPSDALASRPEEDTYLISDLLGLEVFDESGKFLGRLDEVMKRPANDVYRVGRALIPAVKDFILKIDLEARRMTVRLLPGMEDLA